MAAEERAIDGALQDDEEFQAEQTLRPQRLGDFPGQERVKEVLVIAIEAAKKRGEPLDHHLFYGPPGLGKTTLAPSAPPAAPPSSAPATSPPSSPT